MNTPDQRCIAQTPAISNPVSDVGNAWIVCKSKRYVGRNYYFNTVSGESAWDLCPSQIEMAKRKTVEIQDQPKGVNIMRHCPEPKGPPIDLAMAIDNIHSNSNPKIYNGQIIGQQYMRTESCPAFITQQCDTYTTHSVSHNNGLVVQTPVHNPNVWSVPPTPQIQTFTTMNPSEMQTTCLNINHFPQLVPISTLPQPIDTSRFKSSNSPEKCPSTSYGLQNERQTGRFQRSTPKRNFNGECESQLDLRQKLLGKRKHSWQTHEDLEDYDTLQTIHVPNKDYHSTKKIHRKSNLCINYLKSRASKTSQLDCWYIVSDASVLLSNLYFLCNLIKQDENCKLMTPRKVITEIHAASRAGPKNVMARANRAIAQVEKFMAHGKSFIGEAPSVSSSGVYLIDSCLDLHREKYFVVLISNDEEILKHKDLEPFVIMSTNEIKENTNKQTERNNKSSNQSHTELSPRNKKETSQKDNFADKDNDSTKYLNSKKETIDVEVQTDFKFNKPLIYNKANSGTIHKDVQTNRQEVEPLKQGTKDVSDSFNQLRKRRIINLNRNNALVSNESSSNRPKSFKWRRRILDSKEVPKDLNATNKEVMLSPTISQNNNNINSESSVAKTNCNILHNSISFDNSFDEVVETDDEMSCIYQPTNNKSVVIEETSTSGVMSNTASNVDSESVYSQSTNSVQQQTELSRTKNRVHTPVMFEISCSKMEEYLKSNCEEWVSRFLQIMEEVLTQVLQREPCFKHHDMPPPWTVHEASECVKMKYQNDEDVMDASDKLSHVLFDISDNEGKIRMPLQPVQFMELYSYGVYLVDTLQSVASSEDLQTAEESLAKLIYDIQTPQSDTARNKLLDTFNDNANESVNVTIPCSPNLRDISPVLSCKSVKSKFSPGSKKKQVSVASNEKYNLRSSKNLKVNEETPRTETQVKFFRTVEASFFESLNLKKRAITSDLSMKTNDENYDKEELRSPKKILLSESNNEKLTIAENKSNKAEEILKSPLTCKGADKLCEPKIIRNFSMFAEYENRLKKSNDIYDLDKLDYSEEYGEDEDYEDDEEYEDKEYLNYYSDYEHLDVSNEMKEQGKNSPANTQIDDIENNDNFRFIIQTLSGEIKETFLQSHSFCVTTMQNLSRGIITNDKKNEIRCKAKNARNHIEKLCKSLESTCNANNAGIGLTLNLDGFENRKIVLTDENLNEYRDLLKKCTAKANTLYESMDLICSAVEE